MNTLDPKQQEELDRLNKALEEQKFQPKIKNFSEEKCIIPKPENYNFL